MTITYNYVIFHGNLRHLIEATLAFEQTFQLNCNARPVKTITTPKGAKVMVFPQTKKNFNEFFVEALNTLREQAYDGILPRIIVPT